MTSRYVAGYCSTCRKLICAIIVKKTMAFGRQVFDKPGGQNIMTALSSLVSEGKNQALICVEVVGHGFDVIAKGMQTLKGGVSGIKLIVTL